MNAPSLLAVILMVSGVAVAAEKPAGYDAFELTRTRNIFDPNRRAVRKESEQARAQSAAAVKPRSVHLTLTGTMVTDQRTLAFFSGSAAEFNKIATSGEKIGAFTVGRITGGDVELKDGDKVTILAVGKRLQLEGTEADASDPEPAANTAPAVAPEATTTNGGTPAAPTAGSASEILRRMMERRAQEMKK